MINGFTVKFLLCAALLLITTVRCSSADPVMRVSDRQEIPFGSLIEELKGSRLILIGEEHDRLMDHWFQLKVIKALHDGGIPLAIGLEMFTAANQPDLERWIAGKMDEEEFARRFQLNWSVPWPMYRHIFIYARQHAIPLVGLNVPREITRKVARDGFEALTAAEKKELPDAITCDVDAAYMALVRKAFAAHGQGDKLFVRFCEAQMIWNKSMAWRLQGYMGKNPGRTVIVLTGKGHAMKPGIPREIPNGGTLQYRVILPEDEIFRRATVTVADTDYLFLR
jgi:uncharacterized iron-regulated protein